MEGARVPPSAYKYSPPPSSLNTQKGSLPPLLSPSPLRSCSVILGRLGGRRSLFLPARHGAGGLWICLNLFRCSVDPEFGRENLFAASPWYPRGATRVALIIGLSENSTSSSTKPRLPRPRLCGSVIPLTVFKGMIPYSSVYSYSYICIA